MFFVAMTPIPMATKQANRTKMIPSAKLFTPCPCVRFLPDSDDSPESYDAMAEMDG